MLSPVIPQLKGVRLIVVEPLTYDDLKLSNGHASDKSLAAVDQLGAAVGQVVGFTEGREAANPFWPVPTPVDAYCILIVKRMTSQQLTTQEAESEVTK